MCVNCRNIYQDKDNFAWLKTSDTELISGNSESAQNPLVSIIITAYKRKDYIHEAINSAIHQKNVDFDYEILVLYDDPDAALDDLGNYQHIKNIYFYRNFKNLGLYNNTNLAAKIAHGHYIAFLHDDDILYPEYLSEVYKFLVHKNHEPKCVLVNRDVTGLSVQKPAYKKILKCILTVIFSPLFLFRLMFRKPYKKITLREGLTYLLSNIYKAPSCGTLFEKEAFINSGGFNHDFWPVSDYYFFLKFSCNYPVYMLRKKLACYRWFDNLSRNKSVQFMGIEHLSEFFKSSQPINFVNRYYSFFHNEVLYAKFLMVNQEYRSEIMDKYPELRQICKIKWIFFKLFNFTFHFFHDIV
jgi:glycosyltransferase involved in cell wall biosynthesis